MKIFLSWSGDVSYAVATALRKWLPYFIQPLRPFLSSTDISKGARWSDALAKELEDADYGIVCVTPYNLNKAWMNFEAGALSKRFDRAHLTPFLYRLERSQITGPLAQFQSTLFDPDDFLNLLYSLNNGLGTAQLDHELLKDTFDIWWPHLKDALDKIPATALGETRTSYRWLYTTEDLAIHELAATKCIWIVSATTQLLTGAFKETVVQNLRNGIAYRCFLPRGNGIDEGEKAELEELRGESKGTLEYQFIDRNTFEISATTDYVIINPEVDQIAEPGYQRRMFLRLPVQADVDYWIEVDEHSTANLILRFATLWGSSKATVAGA